MRVIDIKTNTQKMQTIIYSNGNQECERAESLLMRIDEDVKVYQLDEDFTEKQFNAEFGVEAEYPQISIGFNHRGSLKETLNFMNKQGMFS